MPARHSDQTKIRTKLAAERVRRGVPQRTMAELLGMKLTAYQRLERGQVANPRLRHLSNAARALGVKLGDVSEPEWLQWMPVPGHPEPPDRESIWHTAPSSPDAKTRARR